MIGRSRFQISLKVDFHATVFLPSRYKHVGSEGGREQRKEASILRDVSSI